MFLLVFVVLSLLLLNVARGWIADAASVEAAGTRLLWMVVPVLIIDAAAALLAALLGARSALASDVKRRTATLIAMAPPLVVAATLAAVGATSAAQTVYDLLAVTAGAWTGAHLAHRVPEPGPAASASGRASAREVP